MGLRSTPFFTLVLALFLTFLNGTTALGDGTPPAATQAVISGPMQVDGVPVTGRTDTVSVADIRGAIKAFKEVDSEGPVALTVISKDVMHGYQRLRDLGWYTVQRTIAIKPDGSQGPGPWDASGQWLPGLAATLHCIMTAQVVYIFPVTTPLKPHRDDKHLRLLDAPARNQLANLLGQKDNWFAGLNDLRYTDEKPTSIGFIFRSGDDELVIFFVHSDVVAGSYNGEHVGATFDDLGNEKLAQALEGWKAHYAQPELAAGD